MTKFALLLLLFTTICNGQSYTEKYNDLYQRYEYFNTSGKMIGYKYYDAQLGNWNYVDMVEAPTTKYISPINTSLVQRALSAKQTQLDYNVERIQATIDDIYEKINMLPTNREAKDRISSAVKSALNTINRKSLDYSNNSITLQVINYLYSAANGAVNSENSSQQAQPQPKLKDEVLAFMKFKGGYRVTLIKEFEYHDGLWRETGTDKGSNYLYYDGDVIWIKRGQNKWIYRDLIFKQHNPLLKMYSFTSPWGDTYIDDNFQIAIFLDNSGDQLFKKYEYVIGDYSADILPNDN